MTVQVDVVKEVLQNKRSELARLIRTQSSPLSVGEGQHELTDQVHGTARRREKVTFLDTFNRTLAQVDAALIAVELGAYGICVECGEPISSRWLGAFPWALHCIRCQKVLDRRSRTRVDVNGLEDAA
jgi:DnaK suppressor protein